MFQSDLGDGVNWFPDILFFKLVFRLASPAGKDITV